MALSVDGRVQCVFEFERLFGIRYYHLMGPFETEKNSNVL